MIGTAMDEYVGYDSDTPTAIELWEHIVRQAQRARRDLGNETGESPDELLSLIGPVYDCEEMTKHTIILANLLSSTRAEDSISDPTLYVQSQNVEPRIVTNRMACFAEQEKLMASTTWQEQPIDLYRLAEVTFQSAEEESFEDGIESELSRQLISLVRQFGDAIVDVIHTLIAFQQVGDEAASVALRTLGEMNHPFSRTGRLKLLREMLSSSSLWVRDGAALGLAWMNDPAAIPDLEKAIERETIEALCRDMTGILERLKRARNGPPA